jgi:hypothetical protein
VNWVPTFGGNTFGWIPAWVLIAAVGALLSVIVVLVVALKDQFEAEEQRDKN